MDIEMDPFQNPFIVKEAKEMDIAYKTGEFPWAASGKAAILGAREGKTKKYVPNNFLKYS